MTTTPAARVRLNVEMHGASAASVGVRVFTEHQPPFVTLRLGDAVTDGVTIYAPSLDDLRAMLAGWIAALDDAQRASETCSTCKGSGIAALCSDCGTRRTAGSVCGCGSTQSAVIGCPNCEPEVLL